MINRYVCEKSTFDEIHEFWRDGLWPGRKTDIEPLNAIVYNRSLLEVWGTVSISKDWTIFDWSEPTFFVMKEEETKKIVGVNSGFKTDDRTYRSRGIYVLPEYRGNRLSRILLENTIQQAKEEECDLIWSLPRASAMPAYKDVGFRRVGLWQDDDMEYGPNYLAVRNL